MFRPNLAGDRGLLFDPEPERLIRRRPGAQRRQARVAAQARQHQMEDNGHPHHPPPPEPTLREVMFPNNNNLRPSGIVLPELQENWELRHSFIQILPKFSDMPGEDPQRHLQDFELVCDTIRTDGGPKQEYIRLISFPFSLQDAAREWLYTLPAGSVTTWQALQHKFLEKYYPVSRIQNARNKLSQLRMGTGESMYDYWNRFKMMLAKCPQHQIQDKDLITYFMNGLRANEKQLVNASCGGSVLNKQASVVFKLFSEMVEESRDDHQGMHRTRTSTQTAGKSEEKSEISELCNAMKQMMEIIKPTVKKNVKMC